MLPLALAACTSSAGGGDCVTLGMANEGTVTATTSDGPYEAACILVADDGGQIRIETIGSTSLLEGVPPRRLSIEARGDTVGRYAAGPPSAMGASYLPGGPDPTGMSHPGGPSEVVLEAVDPRLRGTFVFQETDGQDRPVGDPITGSFDVAR